ncbi:hypothetical protein STCU_05317 [Strigomonas culicis]|nr:hypothetical protein STCU_05317 [Strigomonas culicis]|eukprot:EPY28068.1 hypothetical protein STCU_05317 [Strigomonas culicis]
MKYPAGGKEKMIEGTMALATFNAALCDNGEARALTLRIVMLLLERSEKYADLILGTVVAKKQAVDSPLLRTVLCRFVSTVIRYAHFEKALTHIPRLMDTVQPILEAAESSAQTVAAAVAVGALCSSASVTDSVLSDHKQCALTMAGSKGVRALGGYALIYSLLTAAGRRIDATFITVAAELLAAAAALPAPAKLTSMWVLRAAAALARTKQVPAATFKPDNYLSMLRLVNSQDEQMMSTSEFFCEMVEEAYPAAADSLAEVPRAPSSSWVALGHFDADVEDELVADVTL